MFTPEEALSDVWFRAFDSLYVDYGEGSYLIDRGGKRYLDFTCGIGVTNIGHSHPRVVEALQAQAAKLIHGQLNITIHQPALQLVEELQRIMPPELDRFFFSNAGAEAVEAAVKLARVATGRPNVIVFQGGFHGRTIGTMSLTTSKTVYRAGYQPLMAGVFVAPFPYVYRYGRPADELVAWCLDELRFLLKMQTAPDETAAMLIEPVLGEGGYVEAPPGFMEGLRQICDDYGIVLIADEIQSGVGRTGKWFAFEHYNAVPDIVTFAKGIASGVPISGIAARNELMVKWPVGSHGGTYGGNILACAAAVTTLRVIHDKDLLANTQQQSDTLRQRLTALQGEYPVIGDIRGLGLMIGVEFTSGGKPDADRAKAVIKHCYQNGLMLMSCGPYGNTIRFIPPLNVTEQEIESAMRCFSDALAATA